ncbi:Homeobox-leucine zipper protein ROC5, partial [Cucurbita argyrosperma subsp. sororia]
MSSPPRSDSSSAHGGGIGGGHGTLMASGAIAHPRLVTQSSFSKSMFSSPRLSLALTNIDGFGAGEMISADAGFEENVRRRRREEEATDSRSGSDNMDGGGGSGDDLDAADELDRVCALAGKFVGRPVPVSPPLEEYGGGMMMMERCVYLEMALAAMDELVKMANGEEPLWIGEKLNEEEYSRMFSGGCFGGFVSEASRESALLFLHSSSLLDTLMEANRWVEMFPNLIATATTTDVISGGMGGTRNGALQLQSLNPNQSSMLILQETCSDASGSLVVYAPVDIPAMQVVMNGGDSAYVALLPSGFAVVPAAEDCGGGSLLTVAFQILVNSLPTDKLTVESVETVNNLISFVFVSVAFRHRFVLEKPLFHSPFLICRSRNFRFPSF